MNEAIHPPLSFRNKLGDVPGSWAIWAAILAEMSEFAIMFVVYFLAKVHNPELFYEGPTRLSTAAGTANTLIMLTSSFFVVRAVMAMRANNPKTSAQWLWGGGNMWYRLSDH